MWIPHLMHCDREEGALNTGKTCFHANPLDSNISEGSRFNVAGGEWEGFVEWIVCVFVQWIYYIYTDTDIFLEKCLYPVSMHSPDPRHTNTHLHSDWQMLQSTIWNCFYTTSLLVPNIWTPSSWDMRRVCVWVIHMVIENKGEFFVGVVVVVADCVYVWWSETSTTHHKEDEECTHIPCVVFSVIHRSTYTRRVQQ